MRNWFKNVDIDYAFDALMLSAALAAGVPAAILVCYGTFSVVTSGARLIASVLI